MFTFVQIHTYPYKSLLVKCCVGASAPLTKIFHILKHRVNLNKYQRIFVLGERLFWVKCVKLATVNHDILQILLGYDEPSK